MDDVDLNFRRREALQRIGQGLDGTVHVAFQNDVQLLVVAHRQTTADLFQGEALLGAHALFAAQLLATLRNLLGFALVVHDVEQITCLRGAVQAQDGNRRRRTCFLHLLSALVHHGPNLAGKLTHQHVVAYAQGSVLHQQRGHVTASLVQGCFDHRTLGHPIGIGLEVQQFCLQQYFVQQFLNVQTGFGGNVHGLNFSTPVFHQQVHAGQLLLDFLRIRCGAIYFVDGEYDGNTGRLGVADGFLRLGHDGVVRRYHNNGDVRYLGTASTHGRKGLVARRIQERNVLTAW